MISLAQMTVAGIAGYMVAIFGTAATDGVTPGLAVVAGGPDRRSSSRSLAAAFIGWLSVRTEGIYTIMITLAIGVAFYYLALQNYAVFNGFQGKQKVFPPTLAGIYWRDPTPFYYLALVCALAGYLFVVYLLRTPFGIALQGIRDNPRRMHALGFNVTAHRVAAYAVAGAHRRGGRGAVHLVQRAGDAGLGGHGLAHQHPHHRGARWHAPSGRRVSRRDRLRAAAELRHRRHRPRALQPGDRRGVPRDRPVLARRPARLVGGPERPDVNSKRRDPWSIRKRTVVRALAVSRRSSPSCGGGAFAQAPPVKIGLLATLEGPFAAGGQDGMRGAELAVRQRNGVVAGRKIEIIKASSDAKPDVAVNATRKLVEQDKVDIMVGPLSGSEGIAVKEYSKTQPNITFINGSLGRPGHDARQPVAELLPLQHRRRRSGWWASARPRSTRATSA